MKKIILTGILLLPGFVSANGGFLNVSIQGHQDTSYTINYNGQSKTLTGPVQAYQFPQFQESSVDGTENGGVMLNYSVIADNSTLSDGCSGSINSMKEKLVNCMIYVNAVTPVVTNKTVVPVTASVVATGSPDLAVAQPIISSVEDKQALIKSLQEQIISLLNQLIVLMKKQNERARNN